MAEKTFIINAPVEQVRSVLVAVWIQQDHDADVEKMARYQEKMPVAPAGWDGLW